MTENDAIQMVRNISARDARHPLRLYVCRAVAIRAGMVLAIQDDDEPANDYGVEIQHWSRPTPTLFRTRDTLEHWIAAYEDRLLAGRR